MKLKQTVVMAVAALACSLALALSAFAADNGTEFGIEDDLTVLGIEGNWNDPDADIEGFTFIGGTIPAAQQLITGQAGNVAISSAVQIGQVGAAMSYFGSSVTVNGYGIFQSTVQIGGSGVATNLYFTNGAANLDKVLKAKANGFLAWETDLQGAGEITGIARRLVRFQDDGGGADNSIFYQDAGDLGITLVNGSSLTVTGAFEAGGAVIFKNTANVVGNFSVNSTMFQVTALNGNTSIAGTLGVTGAATLSNNLTVNGNSQLGDAFGTDIHSINTPAVAGTALKVAGGTVSGNYVATFYSGTALAAWIKKK